MAKIEVLKKSKESGMPAHIAVSTDDGDLVGRLFPDDRSSEEQHQARLRALVASADGQRTKKAKAYTADALKKLAGA